MSSQEDPHKGGSLSDIAVSGSTIPNDAGKQDLVSSVPRPNQITDPVNDPNCPGESDLAGATDNPTDISGVPFPIHSQTSHMKVFQIPDTQLIC